MRATGAPRSIFLYLFPQCRAANRSASDYRSSLSLLFQVPSPKADPAGWDIAANTISMQSCHPVRSHKSWQIGDARMPTLVGKATLDTKDAPCGIKTAPVTGSFFTSRINAIHPIFLIYNVYEKNKSRSTSCPLRALQVRRRHTYTLHLRGRGISEHARSQQQAKPGW